MADLYPDFVARFYDVIYHRIRGSVDHDYYVRQMADAQGPVLEIGAGTGRMFRDALARGADAYGLDASATMIDTLKSHLDVKDRERVRVADARSFQWDKKFALIVAPFRVFSHLVTLEDQLSALVCVSDHLAPGGRLIFDLFVPDPELCKQGMPPTVDFDGAWAPGKKLQRITSVRPDLIHQTNHVTMRYIWDENGTVIERAWEFDMRYYFRYEIGHLMARAGFKRFEIYGGFDESPLNESSKDFVVAGSL